MTMDIPSTTIRERVPYERSMDCLDKVSLLIPSRARPDKLKWLVSYGIRVAIGRFSRWRQFEYECVRLLWSGRGQVASISDLEEAILQSIFCISGEVSERLRLCYDKRLRRGIADFLEVSIIVRVLEELEYVALLSLTF